MNKPHDKHHNKHHKQEHHAKRGLHKDWRAWAVVLLMVGAIVIYILTLDESLQPGGGEAPPVPAAE